MSVSMRLESFLKKEGIPYEVVRHPRSVTARETAVAEHIPAGQVAKAVMIKVGGRDTMLVIPASTVLDWFKVEKAFGTHDVRLEREVEFRDIFDDCEAGAMPPMGKLYGVPCFVDYGILASGFVAFNAGTHQDSIRISVEDYLKLTGAKVADLSVPMHGKTSCATL